MAVALWRNGGETVVCGGKGGGGEKEGEDFSVSRIDWRDGGESQGGGRILAPRWRLRRRASQRGRRVRWGGVRGGMGPWVVVLVFCRFCFEKRWVVGRARWGIT